MAGFGGGGAADGLNAAPIGTETSQQTDDAARVRRPDPLAGPHALERSHLLLGEVVQKPS
jgi:hypothetical protein